MFVDLKSDAGSDISFADDKGRKYKWRGNSAGRSFEVGAISLSADHTKAYTHSHLQLYCADDNFASTIARFHRSRRIPMSQMNSTNVDPMESSISLAPTLVDPPASGKTPAVLELAPRAVEIQDLVVVSFLFLEKVRRTNEKEHQNRADSLGSMTIRAGQYAIRDGGVP